MSTCRNVAVTQENAPKRAETNGADRSVARPYVDIVEAPDRVVLSVNLPGVNLENVNVTLEKNVLTIRGRVERPRYEGFRLVYSEFEPGDYERSFHLTAEIDREKIAARMKDGVLTLELPKRAAVIPSRIPVNAG